MSLRDFRKSRWLSIAVVVLVSAFSAVLLLALKAGPYAAAYVSALFLFGEAAALAVEYLKRRSFYRDLLSSLKRLDKKYLISEMLPEPDFPEGKILCEALRSTAKSMNDEVGKCRRETADYREYVESWVHEIKTPISACRLILENNPGKLSRDLQQDFYRIENYVEQALFYARSGSVEKDYVLRRCTLRDLVSSALKKNAGLLISNGVQIETESLDLAVSADVKWMDFILGQIIINSVKYRRARPTLCFCGSQDGNSAALTVEDNGIGIPQSDLGRVFEKGFTGENGRQTAHSTGLGLYLCKKLCDKMGLGISAASLEGSGTAVSIVFPVSEMYGVVDSPAPANLTKL